MAGHVVNDNRKNLLNNNISSKCPYNLVNFVLLAAEICGRQLNFVCGVEQRAPPIFGRAAITLGIGPHSS